MTEHFAENVFQNIRCHITGFGIAAYLQHYFLNPDYAVDIYCDLKNLAATPVSRFCFSTYVYICLRLKIAPTSRFAEVFQSS